MHRRRLVCMPVDMIAKRPRVCTHNSPAPPSAVGLRDRSEPLLRRNVVLNASGPPLHVHRWRIECRQLAIRSIEHSSNVLRERRRHNCRVCVGAVQMDHPAKHPGMLCRILVGIFFPVTHLQREQGLRWPVCLASRRAIASRRAGARRFLCRGRRHPPGRSRGGSPSWRRPCRVRRTH